jgi:ABC-type amino acid transport substrate-binding protein
MTTARPESAQPHRLRLATFVTALLAVALLPLADASADTLDRVRQAGKITLGFRADARPFSFQDGSGKPVGYSVELCQKVVEEVKTEIGLPALTEEWVPVTLENRFQAVQEGKVDLLCGADSETLQRRKDVAFSIPIFLSGIGAILRTDAPAGLRDVLSGEPPSGPTWRGSPAQILQKKTAAVVKGTTGESWLADRLQKLEIDANVAPVDGYDAGIQSVLDRKADVFFGDRPILLEAAAGTASGSYLVVLDRLFTSEPLALALARGDEDFRLVVDRALSRLFRSTEFRDVYVKWFGEPDGSALTFFRQTALPE